MTQAEELFSQAEETKGIKIVFWGPSMSGKTTALSIFHAIKKREDPRQVYDFLKLEDKKTRRTVGFDHAVFGFGKKMGADGHELKYHLFTVPGQDRFKAMRKVVMQGLDGLVIMINSEKAEWEANKKSLMELFEVVGKEILDGEIALSMMLNKMDLPTDQRISSIDVGRLMVEAGVADRLRDTHANLIETSCKDAVEDLKVHIRSGEQMTPDNRPATISRIIQPIQMIMREILVKQLRK
ncbi:MAG: hypothetical protein ACFFCQ_02125 [Promethearchaeota archaeon]